ncbi:palmitoyltransferase ZDHHC23-like [Vespula maculifrons]|uniref:Palmitoyltransferase ZDHHC23-like n=1 Tax=Vespula maculifrons TaxID=7453 RepID=A0ABD2C8L8_VESMC
MSRNCCLHVLYQYTYNIIIAVCFISALYSLIVGIIIFCYLIRHLWLIYLEITLDEHYLYRNQYDHETLKNDLHISCLIMAYCIMSVPAINQISDELPVTSLPH